MGQWGAGYPEGGKPASVFAVGGNGREASFTGENRCWCQVEVFCDPPADSVPEGVHVLGRAVVWA